MTRARWLAPLLACTLAALAQAQSPPDEQRSAWRYRRSVAVPSGAEGTIVAVAVPPEVHARSQADLRDLRLVDPSGREVPYLVQEDTARRVERRWSGYLTEAQRARRGYTTWTVDFGEIITFDRLEIELPGVDFAKRLAIDVSLDGTSWRELGRDYWIFDRPWQSARVHDTALDMPLSEARFVRAQADDTASAPVEIRGVLALRTEDLEGVAWTQEVSLEPIGTDGGRARYRVPVPDGHPVQRLSLDADDPTFARTVSVHEAGRDGERRAGTRQLYRLRLPGTAADLESREMPVDRQAGGALIVEIENGDNPLLVNPRVRLSGPRTLLLAGAHGSALTLYYGNTVTRAPVYGLEPFRVTLAAVSEYPVATPGPEVENPRFRQPAPLAFVATRGAALESGEWRYSRPIAVTGGEDLYTLILAPADASRLRPDLGDLRLVDNDDRQVPYVLERDASSTTVPLQLSPAEARGGRRQTSAWRLAVPDTARDAGPMRLTALRLLIAEPFFERRIEVLRPLREAPLGAIPLASARLASGRRGDASGPVWVQVQLGDDARATDLLLEIADGDNAPLTILQAQAIVPVPRVTFKAGPGGYRLLMGNPEARPPSYELGALGQEVLAYAAVPLQVDTARDALANPRYRRGVTDLVREAPPRAVLWTALGIAVVVLLVLTRRILGRSSPPGK